jgi:DNA mismatch repair protein MutS
MDEVGRGTSTSDGLSLAKGIVDYLNTETQGRTLFATHYHEIIEHGDLIDGIDNFSISVTHDDNGKPIFLHKIVKGGIDKSYGIEVAESAGVPESVIKTSKEYLLQINKQDRKHSGLDEYAQTSLFQANDNRIDKLKEKVSRININETTPLQSMETLNELVKLIESS